jgi:hypothetical protein
MDAEGAMTGKTSGIPENSSVVIPRLICRDPAAELVRHVERQQPTEEPVTEQDIPRRINVSLAGNVVRIMSIAWRGRCSLVAGHGQAWRTVRSPPARYHGHQGNSERCTSRGCGGSPRSRHRSVCFS